MGGVDRQGQEPAVVVKVKGKRSKRQRVHAPPVVLTAPAEEGSGTTSTTGGCVTEEDEEVEEDVALCLVLLSRGDPAAANEASNNKGAEEEAAAVVSKEARFRSRRRPAAGGFVYECRTCGKCFPSFQALGGHRTSHKKPRPLPPPPSEAGKNNPATAEATTTAPSAPPAKEAADATTTAPAAIPAVPVAAVASGGSRRPTRAHECSTCGAEFASGQALGGHMRRHRPLVPRDDDAPRTTKERRSLLELDLNVPAPCDDGAAETTTSVPATSPRFAFAVVERRPAPLLFPAALVVDCHY